MKNSKTFKPIYIQQLEAAIYLLGQVRETLPRNRWNRTATKQVRLLRILLPYCAYQVDDDYDMTILLNRNYKPIGVTATEWVDYAEYPFAHFKQPAGTLDEDGLCYFFDDGTAPWNSRHGLDRLINEYRKFLSKCLIEEF